MKYPPNDFAKKVIVGPKRTSPIRALEKDDKQILLQGAELGLAWSMALNVEDGKMANTFSSRDGAFVLFGACTPLCMTAALTWAEMRPTSNRQSTLSLLN